MYSSKSDIGIADHVGGLNLFFVLLHCQVCACLIALTYSTAQLGGVMAKPPSFLQDSLKCSYGGINKLLSLGTIQHWGGCH